VAQVALLVFVDKQVVGGDGRVDFGLGIQLIVQRFDFSMSHIDVREMFMSEMFFGTSLTFQRYSHRHRHQNPGES
jgi:hypothetical protein